MAGRSDSTALVGADSPELQPGGAYYKICAETLGVPPEAALDPKIEYKLKMIGARRLAMGGLLVLIDHNRSKGFEPTSTPSV